jgi:hypothetical protein
MQVNPESFRGRGIFRIVAEERGALYRGWGWTMARNAPGSFAVSLLHLPLSFAFLPGPTFRFSSAPLKHVHLTTLPYTALRRLGGNKRVRPRCNRLFQSNLGAKLHRISLRSRSLHHRRCPPGHDQDEDTKGQFRE